MSINSNYHQRVQQRRPASRRPGNQRPPITHRLTTELRERQPADPFGRDPALAGIEAAFFIADEPLSLRKITHICELNNMGVARKHIKRLQELYDADGSAFQIEEVAGGLQLLTRAEYHRWLMRLRQTEALRLTPAMRETLAVVAYKQPITRADVEAIRGVHCGEVLRQLVEKGLVRVAGRDDSLGRPVLYGTTKKFLQVYGLKSLKDLPAGKDLPPRPERLESVDDKNS